jgi:hypothetical protein
MALFNGKIFSGQLFAGRLFSRASGSIPPRPTFTAGGRRIIPRRDIVSLPIKGVDEEESLILLSLI